jgi:uncharacterized protein
MIRERTAAAMPTLKTKVDDFLSQRRIAVAGVSHDTSRHAVANLIYRRLKSTATTSSSLTPHLDSFEGDACYPRVGSIPGGVDGVVIINRPEATEQIVHECGEAGVSRVWMHQSLAKSQTSVSPEAVQYCKEHGISIIAGACPMMYGPCADSGHTCMRWILGLTGGLPKD